MEAQEGAEIRMEGNPHSRDLLDIQGRIVMEGHPWRCWKQEGILLSNCRFSKPTMKN
jgi:hypothetical protein